MGPLPGRTEILIIKLEPDSGKAFLLITRNLKKRKLTFYSCVYTNNQVFRQNLSRLLSNVQFCARFSSESARSQSDEQDFDKEAYNRRQKRLVAAIIGSSVGLIGSSYCLYRKLSKANAASPNAALDSRNLGGEKNSDENKEEETDGKSKKGKHGFRERRVRKFALLLRLRQTCYPPNKEKIIDS